MDKLRYLLDVMNNVCPLIRIGHDSGVIIRLSGPIKYQWAKSEGLDFDELLSDGKYKENHRLRMAKWGENVRKEDYGYFCRAAIEMYKSNELFFF